MKFDLTNEPRRYFAKIAAIPHGSKNEAALADYIVAFAKEHGYAYKRDELHNVIVYRPAAKGKEKAEGLMLQAHLDMVCEKNEEVTFDFEKEGLQLEVDADGRLRAQGITLGADDGYGVAYMLALLAEKELNCPPLTCVFTVQEEIGLIGAANLKCEDLRAKRYLNLDGAGEISTTVSSSGGLRLSCLTKACFKEEKLQGYRLFVSGLKGGHSGAAINLHRANANRVVAKVLAALKKEAGFGLEAISGGLKENAIPRESEATFVLAGEVEQRVAEIMAEIIEQYRDSDEGLTYTLERVEIKGLLDNHEGIIDFLNLCPEGFVAASQAIPGLTLASLNMGVVRTDAEGVRAFFQCRSPIVAYLEEFVAKMNDLGHYTGALVVKGAQYPGWGYEANSPLRKLLKELLAKRGLTLVEQATHGGLECGYFKALIPDLDIITYGPVIENMHTPDEWMDLASFDRCYEVVKELVENC